MLGQHSTKRSSLASNRHHNSVSSIDATDIAAIGQLQKIQKDIEYVYKCVRFKLKEKKLSFEENELKEVYRRISSIYKHHCKLSEQSELSSAHLRSQFEKYKEEKQQCIKKITVGFEDEIKIIESQKNQKILELNAKFGRKEQEYKQLISNFMMSLNKAQQTYQSAYSLLTQKYQIVSNKLKIFMEADHQNVEITRTMKQMIEDINLKHENSVISEKSDEISIDQIQISSKKLQKHRPAHHFDQSSMEKVLFQDQEIHQEENNQKNIQLWLKNLICFGFFSKENAQNVTRILSVTSNLDHYLDLLNHQKYNIILEMIKLKLKENQQVALQYLDDQVKGNSGHFEEESHSRIELRNIENMSELSINDSNINLQDQLKFKRKQIC